MASFWLNFSTTFPDQRRALFQDPGLLWQMKRNLEIDIIILTLDFASIFVRRRKIQENNPSQEDKKGGWVTATRNRTSEKKRWHGKWLDLSCDRLLPVVGTVRYQSFFWPRATNGSYSACFLYFKQILKMSLSFTWWDSKVYYCDFQKLFRRYEFKVALAEQSPFIPNHGRLIHTIVCLNVH